MSTQKSIKIINGTEHIICTKCKEWLPKTEEYFYIRNRETGAFKSQCKECDKKYSKAYHKKYRDKSILCSKLYYAEHRIELREKTNRRNSTDEIKILRKEYKDKHKDRIAAQRHEYYCRTKEKFAESRILYKIKNKKRMKEHRKEYYGSLAVFKTWAHQLTIEEDPKKDNNGHLLVKCAYCGIYCNVILSDVRRRSQSLLGITHGENRLYCSQGCKLACPIFRKQKYPEGFKPATSREVNPLIRQMCLKRDKYMCQKCGKGIQEIELHAHHIEGAVQMPMLANDVNNTITLCKPCHKWVHFQDGCTYRELRCN